MLWLLSACPSNCDSFAEFRAVFLYQNKSIEHWKIIPRAGLFVAEEFGSGRFQPLIFLIPIACSLEASVVALTPSSSAAPPAP